MAQNVAITLGYFLFCKSHNEPPKVAQLGKKSPNLVTLWQSQDNLFICFVSLGENDSAQKWQFEVESDECKEMD